MAPALIAAAGGSWVIVPKVYAVALLVTAILFSACISASDPSHLVKSWRKPLSGAVRRMQDPRVWRAIAEYYSAVFAAAWPWRCG